MSTPVIFATRRTTLRQAASIMGEHHVGALPVVEGDDPVGIVTDRDIVIRILLATDLAGATPVAEAMTPAPVTCYADQDVAEAAIVMGDRQIRRLLVIERSGELVGILSVGDIAEKVSEELAGQALGEISEVR